MDPQYLSVAHSFLQAYVVPFVWRLLGALALWIVGGWVIRLVARLAQNAMRLRHLDRTLTSYAEVAILIALKVLLIIAVLSVFGIETTSLAALLAGAGIAIGTAWSGLLSNFAAGVFLVVLRPFRVGDIIQVSGISGEVKNIGLFMISLDTGENARTYIGNSKVFGDIIVNYSINNSRRVELRVQLAHGVDATDAIARLGAKIALIPHVLKTPAPQIAINEFTASGPVLAVRPYTAAANFQQVWFDTNKAIAEVIAEAGYPVPATHQINRSDGVPSEIANTLTTAPNALANAPSNASSSAPGATPSTIP
jgi:small conductance mechanosensitive channel